MLSPVDSFAAKASRDCLRDLDRAHDAWLSLATSRSPGHVALALRWFGRHLSENAWRMEVSFEVDALGAEGVWAAVDRPVARSEIRKLPDGGIRTSPLLDKPSQGLESSYCDWLSCCHASRMSLVRNRHRAFLRRALSEQELGSLWATSIAESRDSHAPSHSGVFRVNE